MRPSFFLRSALGPITLVILAGCVSSSGPEDIAQRIGPAAFDPDWPMPRPAVVQLGDEARPVVHAPRRTLVSEERAVFVHDGVARLTLALPPALQGRSDDTFELLVLPLPWDVPMDEKTIQGFREKGRFERRSSGWRVRRTDGGARAVIEIDESDAKQLVTRVQAVADAPLRLETRGLDFGDGTALQLGYGAVAPVAGDSYVFRAALECPGDRSLLVDEVVDAESASRWRDRTVPLPSGTKGCRLALESERRGGGGVPGGVWAVPQVLRGAPGAVDAPPNIILISLDTLRADHVSGYGYVRETTPVIDRELIARGTTFLDATATFPRTDVSHLSLMTATYPSAQPVRGRLAPGSPIVMLGERLQDVGYETWAFGESGLFGGPYGFWHGFDRFMEFPYDSSERGVGVFREGAAALAELKNRRFFLMLHTYKTHDPWDHGAETAELWADPEAWTSGALDARVPEEQRTHIDAYDRTIREADILLGGFLRALEEAGLADRTLVVLVSDHGEAFGEHVITSHGYGFGQEQLHVPMIFRGPGVPVDRRVETPVSLVDVAPTLLDFAGAEPMEQGQGISLRPAFRGVELPGDRPLFFAWIQDAANGYRLGSRKIVRARGMSAVYDLANDPLESARQTTKELTDDEFHVMHDHLKEAARRREETSSRTVENVDTALPITDKMKDALKALGYVE